MERERITISIKKTVLDQIDGVIDGTKIRNRSHAVETLALKAIGEVDYNQAVILLGGDNALKSIPAAKQYLLSLKDAGFTNVTIAVGFLAEKVKEKIGFGLEYDLSIQYNDKGEGSGGALNTVRKDIKSSILVINTDKKISIDLKKFFEFHKKKSALMTVATDSLDTYEGVYIIEPEALKQLPKGFSMIEDDLIPKLAKMQELIVFPVSD